MDLACSGRFSSQMLPDDQLRQEAVKGGYLPRAGAWVVKGRPMALEQGGGGGCFLGWMPDAF